MLLITLKQDGIQIFPPVSKKSFLNNGIYHILTDFEIFEFIRTYDTYINTIFSEIQGKGNSIDCMEITILNTQISNGIYYETISSKFNFRTFFKKDYDNYKYVLPNAK